jgi:hypothetical protein
MDMTRPSLAFRLFFGPIHKDGTWALMKDDEPYMTGLRQVLRMAGIVSGFFVAEWLAVFVVPHAHGPNYWLAAASPLLLAGIGYLRHFSLRMHGAHVARLRHQYPEEVAAATLDMTLPDAARAPRVRRL